MPHAEKPPLTSIHFRKGVTPRQVLILTLQHLVDQRPEVRLNCIELTLKYRHGLRKVVGQWNRGLVNLARRKIDLPLWAWPARVSHP